MRIVFMGTPEFALPSLKKLTESRHKIVAVISQPDREKNKKGELIFTPVKEFALSCGLSFYAFEKVSKDGLQLLKDLKPDLIVTAAFGQLLSQEVIDSAKLGIFNVHASLLPSYRGSSPIHAAILNGDTVTGVTIMKTVLKMDAGDILSQCTAPISDSDRFNEINDRLASIGASLLLETIDSAENGSLKPYAQDENKATYTKKITKADGLVDFKKSAGKVLRQINAMYPWPCGYTFFKGKLIKIHAASLSFNSVSDGDGVCSISSPDNCGEILSADKSGIAVRCGKGAINITRLQAAGKNALSAEEFLRGFAINEGEYFTNE